MKVKSWKTAKLGRLRGMGNYVHIAEDADNSSILVLGVQAVVRRMPCSKSKKILQKAVEWYWF